MSQEKSRRQNSYCNNNSGNIGVPAWLWQKRKSRVDKNKRKALNGLGDSIWNSMQCKLISPLRMNCFRRYAMMTKHGNSRILREVHEMASGLQGAGLIDKRRMLEFDALCHLDVHEMSPEKIRRLREKAQVSQAVFAAVLNTSVSTVKQWEVGDKHPSGPALKLLNLVEQRG